MRALKRWFFGGDSEKQPIAAASVELAPATLEFAPAPDFDVCAHLGRYNGYPILRWEAVQEWTIQLPEADRITAWSLAEHAWLLHFRDALGEHYSLASAPGVEILSSLNPRLTQKTQDFIQKTMRRLQQVLAGLVQFSGGNEILLVFDTADEYYDYVGYYYPDEGEFGYSSGMFIAEDCGHFVTIKNDLSAIEPIVVHEMTHSGLCHLNLPTWLNEGLAVNMEIRLTGKVPHTGYTEKELRLKHLSFWTHDTLAQFFSGTLFQAADEAQMLAYDLARALVLNCAEDWELFKLFVLAIKPDEDGLSAAEQHLSKNLYHDAEVLLGRTR